MTTLTALTAVPWTGWACMGETLCAKSARDKIGVKPGDLVQLSSSHGSTIHRVISKIPQVLVSHSDSGMIYVTIEDMELLGICPGDSVSVGLSSEAFSMP